MSLYTTLENCIVLNVNNTVFGSMRAQLHHLLFVAVLTFAVLVCRCFDHTPASSSHAHLDLQRYDMACRVTRERASDGAENLGRFLGRYGAYIPGE